MRLDATNVLAINPGSGTLLYKLLAIRREGGSPDGEAVLQNGNIDHVHGDETVHAAEQAVVDCLPLRVKKSGLLGISGLSDDIRDLEPAAARGDRRAALAVAGSQELITMKSTSTYENIAKPVRIAAGSITLAGDLVVPAGARGIVVFAHGSGSGRHSPRNRFVAEAFQAGGLATLLFDLLTEDEEYQERFTRHLRFDIGLLARRLIEATDWLARQPETRDLNVGYFGASTGGGAALVAAAERPEAVGAVVSRGGRPDLAGEALRRDRAPTLLIVGGADTPVITLNR